MSQLSKRKNIKVKVSKTHADKALEIDLKSAMQDEEAAPVFKKEVVKDESKEKKADKPFFSSVFSSAAKPKKEKKEKAVKPKEKHTATTAKKPPKLQINLYKKIAFSFIFLTLVLVGVIVYFSFTKVIITVIPSEEKVNSSLIIDIFDQSKNASANKNAVPGVIESVEVEQTKIYPSTGTEVVGEETTGKVTITNNNNQVQTLVATTRLLSPDEKLFRIKDTVYVPAKESVEVEVYADVPGENMAIGPTRFTIPGLWAGLQDKVYAESSESFKHEEKVKKHIAQADIDSGIEDLKKELKKKAEEQIGEKYKNYSQVMYDVDVNSLAIDIDSKAGEEKDEFSITMKTAVVIVAFNDGPIKNMAKEKLISLISDDKELASFNDGAITYSLEKSNFNQGAATVKAVFEGKTALKDGNQIIDVKKLFGLTREQLNDFLGNEPNIKDYEVKYCPSFIDKVPSFSGRIKIDIKD